MQMAISKVEDSAQVLSCQLKFVHDLNIYPRPVFVFVAGSKHVDANQEMIALGICNLAGSFVRSMPTTGSFSRDLRYKTLLPSLMLHHWTS
jgi:hypothetical protein